MPVLLIYSLLPNAYIPLCSTNKKYLEKLQSHQKHAIRIIFNENKFAHTREHFKENTIPVSLEKIMLYLPLS